MSEPLEAKIVEKPVDPEQLNQVPEPVKVIKTLILSEDVDKLMDVLLPCLTEISRGELQAQVYEWDAEMLEPVEVMQNIFNLLPLLTLIDEEGLTK